MGLPGVRFLFLVVFLLSVLGSAAYADALIEGVPHIEQKPDFCGEACVAMYMRKLGVDVDQDWVFDKSGLDPMLGRGVYTKELVPALRRIGFDVPHPYKGANTRKQIEAEFEKLVLDLRRGVPSIVCMHYSDQPRTTEHFRLILGLDEKSREVIYHEPADKNGAYRRMPVDLFLKLWPLGRPHKRVVIRIPLVPGKLVEGTASSTPTPADRAQRVMELRQKTR